MPEEISGKKVISCSEIGLIEDCDFRFIGDTVDEVVNKIIEHAKKEHNTAITPESELGRIIRSFVRHLGEV